MKVALDFNTESCRTKNLKCFVLFQGYLLDQTEFFSEDNNLLLTTQREWKKSGASHVSRDSSCNNILPEKTAEISAKLLCQLNHKTSSGKKLAGI